MLKVAQDKPIWLRCLNLRSFGTAVATLGPSWWDIQLRFYESGVIFSHCWFFIGISCIDYSLMNIFRHTGKVWFLTILYFQNIELFIWRAYLHQKNMRQIILQYYLSKAKELSFLEICETHKFCDSYSLWKYTSLAQVWLISYEVWPCNFVWL